eukprot:jgi/Tetstr1/426332/TSEL_016645.t1
MSTAEDDQRAALLASPDSPAAAEWGGAGIEAAEMPGVPPRSPSSGPLPPLQPASGNAEGGSMRNKSAVTSSDMKFAERVDSLPTPQPRLSLPDERRPHSVARFNSDLGATAAHMKMLKSLESTSYIKRFSEGAPEGQISTGAEGHRSASGPAAGDKHDNKAKFHLHMPHPKLKRSQTSARKLGHEIGVRFKEFASAPSSETKSHMNRPVEDLEPSRRGDSSLDEYGAKTNSSCSFPVIHPLSKFRNYWDFIVILLVIYTTLVLPVRTAFLWSEEVVEDEFGVIVNTIDGWTVMDLVIDFTFLFDVVLNFNTGFIREPDFVTILSRKKIALNYCKGWFVFDVVSSVPLDLIIMQESSTVMKLPRVLRLIRIFRLVKVLRLSRAVRYAQRLQIFARMSTFGMRITKLICLGIIFLHWNACAQFLVAAATDFPPGCWVEAMDVLDDSMFTQYSWSMFMASSQMFCIGYGSTTPRLIQEAWVNMVSFIMGASLFAVFVGIITSVLISVDSISSAFYQKMEIVNQYMAHRKLPLDLRQRIRDSMDYKWRTRRALDEGAILADMPGGLRSEVAVYTCKPLIMRVPFFNEVPDGFIESLVLYLQPEVFLSGELVVKEGVMAREMFFLNTGSVRISKNGIEIVTLNKGNYFGEIGLLLHAPRSATVAAISDCEVYVLTKTALEEVLTDFPQVRSKLEDVAEERLQDMLRKSKFPSKFSQIQEEEEEEEEEEAAGEAQAGPSTPPSGIPTGIERAAEP